MEVIAGILHDSYTDENGKEIPYEEKVVGVLEDDTFKCTSIPEFTTNACIFFHQNPINYE